jgi:transglutaminase-like putative cysteine protease
VWRRQDVTVEALRGRHLVAASAPVAYEVGGLSPDFRWGGIAEVEALGRGTTYTVWSYSPRPGSKALARQPARYPAEHMRHGRYLRPARVVSVPPFGRSGRDAVIRDDFRIGFYPDQYLPLYEEAKRVVGNPKSPYGAVVALESWFRRSGGFTYSERPGPRNRTLVGFVLSGKRGYCQHFAGAMALMLRYLGIPSRVAVGFTSGDYDSRSETWTVTDHDAHAWVEVWFPRYGWLPFDPTPTRGELSGTYTAGSPQFRTSPDVLALLGGGVAARLLLRERLEEQRLARSRGIAGPSERRSVPVTVALVLAAALALLVAVKEARRRLRYFGVDPVGRARACRGELAGFLADQGIRVPASATPAEVAALLRERLGVDAGRFAAALGAARYGRDRRAASRVRHALRLVERALRRRLPLRARARGALSLRSLTTS